MNTITLAENGLLPSWLIRYGIRNLVRQRLTSETEDFESKKQNLIDELRSSPMAVETEAANQQHYEVPAAFYQIALGKRLKYSCCYWPADVANLDEAEVASLKQVCERAQIVDGQKILELGCGWGSFSLWAAEHYPNSSIVSVSNSSGQRKYIMDQAHQRGLTNLNVITADMNEFSTYEKFDRVVSVEMFEHMRNYQQLFERIYQWLNPGAKMFVHVFSHNRVAYLFEDEGEDDWMARHFFTGGIMPSHDLLPQFCTPFQLGEQWHLDGIHYQKTADAWLENLDRDSKATREAIEQIYGQEEARVWMQRWRIFMMSCSELFGFRKGQEWGVSHYLFCKD